MEYRVNITVRGAGGPHPDDLLQDLLRVAPETAPVVGTTADGTALDVTLLVDARDPVDATQAGARTVERALDAQPERPADPRTALRSVTVAPADEPFDGVLRCERPEVPYGSQPKREAAPVPSGSTLSKTIAQVIDLLDQTRHTFKSKQIQRARELLESLLR